MTYEELYEQEFFLNPLWVEGASLHNETLHLLKQGVQV
jgi:hypothetical protein